MNLTFNIPDDIVARTDVPASELERRAREMLLADEYRLGHLNKPDLRRLLGFETSDQIDAFLKRYNVNDLEELQEAVGRGPRRSGRELVDASAKIRGLLTDEDVDTLFRRNSSSARRVDFE